MGPNGIGMGLGGGNLVPIPPNASREEQIAALNDIIARLNAQLKSQTFTDGTNKRYISGYQAGGWPGGDFGIKLSAPGYDVTDLDAVLLYSWDFTTNQQVTYTNGVPTVLVGSAPGDGRGGVWSARANGNVIAQLGG